MQACAGREKGEGRRNRGGEKEDERKEKSKEERCVREG
jgi:hypothetical protein